MRNGLYLRDGYVVTLALRNARLCAHRLWKNAGLFTFVAVRIRLSPLLIASGVVGAIVPEITENFIVVLYYTFTRQNLTIIFIFVHYTWNVF